MNGRIKTWISSVLVAASMVLLFLGARDFFASRFGQIEARRDFERSVESTPESPGANTKSTPSRPRLRPGDPFARLIIPRLRTDLYVVEGDGASELRAGPGHLSGTAQAGGRGNCVIAGHRDTHFRVLRNIRKGDDIILETKTGQYLYRVRNTRIVRPDNTKSLQPSVDGELHLITCYPFYYIGSAPKRFVVEARLAGAVGQTS